MRRRLAFVPLAVTGVLMLVGFGLLTLTPRAALPVGSRPEETIPYLVVGSVCGIVGGILSSRRPENSIGWALGGMGLVCGVEFATVGYALYGLYGPVSLPLAAFSAWTYSWAGMSIGLFGGWIVLTFPEGRIASRRAGAGAIAIATGVLLATAHLMFRPGPLAYVPSVANPLGDVGAGQLVERLAILGAASLSLGVLLAVAALRDRFRAARGVERQQLKWFLASLVLIAVVALPALPLSLELAGEPILRYAARVATTIALGTLPLAVGLAILRYRLYEIDLLIRRTLVYALVSAILVATYVAAVVLVGAALRPFTAGSDPAVAVSTLVVVALFQPIRRRVQNVVDRRFYRSRYDAVRTIDAFAARLRDEVELNAVRDDLLVVVGDTVRPAHASLWLR